MATAYRVYENEWDKRLSMIVTGVKNDRNELLLSIKREINLDVERSRKVIRQLDSEGMEYTAGDVISRFRLFAHQFSLFTYMKGIIDRLKENGRIRTSETYYSALRSFSKFREGEDLLLDSISSQIMESYEGWLRQRGVAPNTVSFYARILRAVYNRAVDEGIIENSYPFKHVYTGIDKTVKRALPVGVIRKITSLDLSGNHSLEYARDMFVLSFMFRGMSLIDMAFLKKTALSNGYLTYRRRKTGQLMMIKWTGQMQAILNKYPDNETGYLLPIINTTCGNERCAYRNAGYSINRHLKMIARIADVPIPLTLYVARHSWASIARSKGVPLSVISEGMGHDSELTTRIYLASLDCLSVDRANSLVINSILK